MTEDQWASILDPEAMQKLLRDTGMLSERKARLFIVACCRHLWHMLEEQDRNAVVLAEKYADGLAVREDLGEVARRLAFHQAVAYFRHGDLARAVEDAAGEEPGRRAGRAAWSVLVAVYWSGPAGYDRASIQARYAAREAERARQWAAVRCVFGDPSRSVAVDPSWLRWNGGTVARLAQAAYQDRQLPGGHLDRARLAVLADALEEAGCADAGLLSHLRSPGPHVRGCAVIDALLGKS
jgi:hypothetical protein